MRPHRSAHVPRRAIRPGWLTRLRRATGRDANPLWRRLDRSRARLAAALLLAVLLAVPVAAGTTAAVYRANRHTAARLAAHRHQVTATALAAAPAVENWGAAGADPPVLARWRYPGDRVHTAKAPTPAGTARGGTFTLWVDDAGLPAKPPRTVADITADAAITGLAVLSGAILVCACGYGIGRRRIGLRADAAWERDWALVEPGWSGRSRSA